MTKSSPMAKGCRVTATCSALVYLLLPSLGLFASRLPIANDWVVDATWASMLPVGLLALGCLLLSLLRPEDRNWRATDRTIAIPMAFAAVVMALQLVVTWPPDELRYTTASWRMMWFENGAVFVLVLLSAFLLFARAWWAIVPLALLAVVWTGVVFPKVEPDGAGFLKAKAENERKAPFREAVDGNFWSDYSTTQTPDDVRLFFSQLSELQLEALAQVIGADAVASLLESGDDTAFLKEMGFGQRRDETGHLFFPTPPAGGRSSGGRFPIHVVGGRLNWFYCAALVYALVRSGIVLWRRRAEATA